MFNVNADYFRAAAVCQSTEETRFYLQGVYIEPHPVKGVVLVATDGNRMIVVHDESGACGSPMIVRLDKPGMKATNRERLETKARRVVMDQTGEVWVKADGGAKIAFVAEPIIDGTFPDWRRVLPGAPNAPVYADVAELQWFNPAFLVDFATASKALESGNYSRLAHAVRVEPGRDGGPAMVRFGTCDMAFGIIMPLKGVDFARGVPDFVNARPAEAKAA